MATSIIFAAATVHGFHLSVEESSEEVFAALTAAGGLPFRLTSGDQPRQMSPARPRPGSAVYVNPETIAYWFERPAANVPWYRR